MSSKTYKTTIVREGSMCFIPVPFDPAGETLDVKLDLDAEKREVKPPSDFVKALKSAPPAWDRGRELSFSHQREYVEAIEEAKKPETRARGVSKGQFK